MMVIKKIELTESQKGIYFDCQLDPVSYNISASILLYDLKEEHFENAFELLIREQEALRSSLDIENDLPVLVIHDSIDYKLLRQDLSDNSEKFEELYQKILEEELCTPFDLTKAPLFRARLVKLDQNKHLFFICIHHIISDGVSLEILKKKLLDYYYKLENNESIEISHDTGFADFIQKENDKLANGKYVKQKEYWMERLKGAEPLAFQPDYSVRKKDSNIGKEKRFEIPEDLLKKATHLSMNQEVTTFMLFLASFGVLMHRYTREEDIVLSSPFTYRPSFDYEETVGCFVSMLPIRMNIEGSQQFSSILQQVSKELINVYKNIGYPNNLIMRDSQLVPMPGSPSIFDISFVYDVYEESEEYHVKNEVVDNDIVTFPGSMMVVLNKTPKNDLIKIQYKPDIFSDETIELMGRRFLKLLEAVVDNVDIKINDIDLFIDNEKDLILNDFNSSSYFTYEPKTIIDIFHSKVEKYPNRRALIFGEKVETYASVNAKANQLCRKILERKTRPNEAIGLQMERSIDMVVAILAILKAGCAYVPIAHSFPSARKEFIFEDANISLLITSSNLPCEKDWDLNILYIDDAGIYTGEDTNPEVELDPYSLAYIMYTSGSTGKPKGVMVENHSVVNTLLDLERRFPMEEQDIFLLKTAFTFDVSVTELFGWFMGEGALLILEPGAEKNPSLILDEVQRHRVTHINFVPTMFRLFLELFDTKENIAKLESLKWIFVGGEAVTSDIVQKFNSLGTNIRLENVYGPTECTIWASHCSLKGCEDKTNIPIGQPLNEIRWYVVNEKDKLQPIGIPGELCLSGVGLARGYLNRDELTKEKFVQNPFYREGIDPKWYQYMYRTGDLARWTADGTIEFLGRMDFQVKVRGVRLELEEIEKVLSEYEGIVQAVVVVKKEAGRPEFLCAYYLSEKEIPAAELKKHLSNSLPEYMIPSFFVHKKELPVNTSGKTNRNALIADTDYRKNVSSEYFAPTTELEQTIASVFEDILGIPKVGLDDNFFEIGGHSLALIQVHNRLKKLLNREFSITALFQMPTIRLLAEFFTKEEEKALENRNVFFQKETKAVNQDIAIIGISIRVPGARNPYEFWENLKNEKECIHFYTDEELEKLGVSPEVFRSPNYVKAKGRIDDIDYFDPYFFEYTPGEVRMMSPQLRLLYQGTWEALEDAGYYPGSDSSRIGIFIGGSDDFEWYKKALFGGSDFSDKYQAFTLSTNHFLATRLSYKLDIKGPVLSALTGCSTTLVTPHLARQSLILGECDLAIAGGITIELPNEGGYFYEEGMMFSPDGHCRPFDAKAKGTVFSNGLALVVMKRLKDAIRDNDNIYAVIKGSAVNNDGNQKVGFVAPSVEGQAEVIRSAYRNAGIDPETVSYVEAHGTGTSLGDPIEVESLTKAFATDKKQFCILGSVKGNVGHADTAAGVVGLAKVALCLNNKFIPGTVNYEEPNPKINFENTPFIVKAHGTEWKKENVEAGILRAGINSFGVGGTNVHVVLEEAPEAVQSSPAEKVNLLTFSAKTPTALEATSKRVLEYLLQNPGINVSDAAWTLKVGRKPFPFRKSLVINDEFYKEPEKIIKKLEEVAYSEVKPGSRDVYLMFPGQGSQYQGMGRELYFSADKSVVSKIFKTHIDEVFELLNPEEQKEFLELMYGNEDPQKINQTQYTQFALFATSYALAKTMIEIGIKPKGMIGHSIGEVIAAVVAGVFELKDAVEIVRFRGKVMQKQEPGIMLSVMAPASEIEKELEPGVWLALENTTGSCVVGGRDQDIAKFEEKLKGRGINCTRVRTSHAFHTPMMEKAAQEFEKMLSGFTINEPQIPIVSNVSGTWAKEGEMTSPSYWSEHILRPVKFSQCLAEVLKNPEDIFIEVGAGNILSSFARQHECKKPGQKFINLIRHIREAEDDVEYLNKKLGQIWCAGVEIDWDVLKGDSVRKRVSLPAYVFDKIPFPIEVKMDQMSEAYQEAAVGRVQDTAEYVLPALLSSVNSGDGSELENAVIEAYKSIFGFDAIDSNQDFFEMGGDSLKAVSLSATLKKMLGVKVEIKDIFAQNTPAKLAAFIRENNASIETDTSIRPAEKADYYPLSSSQRRMYTFYLMDKKSLAYNLYSATLIEGELEKERTEEAVRKLILRHESLRTSFHVIDGQIVQKLNDIEELPIAYSERKYETEEDLNAILKDFVKPFDLSKAPLFRIELVKVGENRQLLLFDIHHIIADGTAVEILTRDFNTLYFGELEPLKIHYKDYAIWQNNYMQSEEMKKKKEFWLNHLSGEIPKLEMPTDFERPHITSFKGGRVEFYIDKELTEKIGELSRKFGATNFMTMLSAWYVLLAKYSGQEEIIVGTPVSGRTRDEIRETVGMFVNMLAIRSFPSLDKKYDEFLNEVKENTFEALKNQDYQFDTLVEHMDIKRELNRNPVFDVSFDYHNMETFDLEVEGLKFIPCQVPIESVSLDLLLTCNEENNGLACFIDYSTSLFKRETIERMAQHYINILCAITKSQDIELGQIDMLTEWDRELIFGQFKKTSLPIEDDVLIQEMFERNAKNLPDKVALVLSDGREITYRELNHRANILAWKLIDMGIKEDTMVGIIPERDENLIVAMLGILKAGGAYVPIDPKFPADRISHMVSQSNINVLICPEKYRNLVDINAQAIDLSKLEADLDVVADPPKRANKDNLAYVIFTSGSTGTPKGVMVKHEGVVNLISDHIARGIFSGEDDRIICMATPSFDIFVFESLLPLCTGHSIYMADETEYLDSSLLGDKIVQYKVTHIQSPVSKLRAMVENPNFGQALSQLKVIVAGGENYPVSLMKHLQKHTNARLYNMYGPTETTVTATVKDLTDSKSVTIGEAIANTQLFVISEKGMLQPVGVYGELCIAGRGLSKGYINNPEETANRFVKLPEDSSIDIYRTGDCARMLDTGEFELKGRLDSQVKIRGYRIELGEIENIAMQNPNVSYAVAKAFAAENGNSHLALFYCDKEENGEENKSSETLKDWLMKKLPNYMMPTHIIKLDKMPLLPNGKVNKRALTLPEEEVSEENKKASMPMKRIEKEIIKIWKDMLGVQHITVKDNFFDIGGTSYTLMLVNNRLNELLGYTVPLMQLFENPTVELLAKSFNISENSPLLLEEDEIEATDDSEDIAVIGMYGRFPGADGVEELWNNIVAGKECLREFSDEELKQSGIPEEEINDPNYVRRKGYLEGVEYFDADFFNYSRKEANTMDPQIRLLHMCVWNALENAGYNPFEYSGKIGLFAGSGANISWLARYFGKHNNAVNSFEVMTLNDKDFVTTKVSYKLNLKGPSVNVQTACSTSLVAIHQAVKYLQCGEADIAVAGGVSISYPRKEGYLWHEGMIFSKDGHCRPFSENASGTVSGNGCAIVVLKKLDRAIKDNDHIYAVIKGSAINNDGIEKIGYTAPSISGQRDVIEKALKKAKIKPEEIQYVEAHGTGTTLGDPIEIEALKQAWKSQKKGYCAIGSVKANIGHLDAAAGVTGCIKAIQVLNKRVIPPMINFKGINPRIDIENSPFYINTSAKTLSAEIARAAVSSFGIGGTNAHVILEEAPKVQKSDEASEVNILLFSARSENALINTSRDVLDYIVGHRELNMSDVAWTLQVGRGNFEYRKAIVVKGKNLDNSEALQTFINDKGTKVPDGQKTVLLMLADSSNLAKPFANSIYKFKGTCGISKKFEDYVQVVLGELTKTERMNLEKQLADDGQMSGFENDITVFIMNYSLCMTLKDIGVLPDVIYGERIGKLSGLVVAGSISLGDAVQIIRTGIDKDIYPSNYPDYQWRDANVPVIDSIDAELKKELNSSIVINAGCNDKVIEELGTDAQAIIPVTDKGQMDVQELYQVLGMLWCNGCKVDWYAVHKGKRRARIPLPGYVFDKIEFDSDVVLSDIFNRSNDEDVKKVNTDKPITSFEDIRDELMKIWNEVLGTQTVGESDDFFELGGDSLNAALFASLVKKKLEINIPVSEIFNNSRFGDLVNWLYQNKPEQMANKEENQIRILEKQPYYETSSAQKRMYAVSQLIGDALSYNLASVYLIEGKLDRPKLEETFNTLVMRHESFRTYFGLVDGQVVQYIADEVPSVVEFANVDEKEVFEEINRSIKPFDLSKAPLMRVKFISVSDVKHYAVIDMHHIISDQSSIDILLQEFTMIYKGEKLPKNEVRYIDFAAWQNQLFKKGLIEKQIDYWMKELSGEIPVLDMYTDFQAPQGITHKGKILHFSVDKDNSLKINQFAKELRITPYMLMMASLKLLLYKYSGQKDLIIGTAVAGRNHLSLNTVVGMFVNLLPIRSQIDESLSVKEYLGYIKDKMVAAFENQDCQFDMIVEKLNMDKGSQDNPLFNVVINYVNMGTEELEIENLTLTPWLPEVVDTKYNIHVTILEKDNVFDIDVEYSIELFKEESMELFGKRFVNMVNYLVEHQDSLLSEISLVTPEEENWLYNVINNTKSNAPIDKNVVHLFEESVRTYGDRIALNWENEDYTYKELNSVVNQLAQLIADKGIKYGDKVAILTERSPIQIISILAILKCGAVYLPIDYKFPDDRVNFMLGDSGAKLLLTYSHHVERIEQSIEYLLLDSKEAQLDKAKDTGIEFGGTPQNLCGEDEAYILYTSGSTGKPKGAIICHKSIIRTVLDTNYVSITPEDKVLQMTNYTFDPSVFDIFGALLNGATLVMVPHEAAFEMPMLAEIFESKGITVCEMVTSVFNMIVDYKVTALKNVRKMYIGGEEMSLKHTKKAFEALGPGRVVNVYGPTEATVIATYYPIEHFDPEWTSIPIGKPISHTEVYVLDEEGRLLPPNMPGELCIGGCGVAKGYLNRKELTESKFINLPFGNGERVYRTGDRVLMTAEGDLIFLGRIDFQIKLRGFRIELGEVEKLIASVDGVKDVTVVANKDNTGSMYIAAYYTVDGDGYLYITPDYIRAVLQKQVPEYMIPSRMKRMDKLPLTENGKVNRKALPAIHEESVNVNKNGPRNEEERLILDAMREVLGNPGLGVKDDFFVMGGHSIKAIELAQKLREIGYELRVNDIFKFSTTEELAKYLGSISSMSREESPAQEGAQEHGKGTISLNEKQIDSMVQYICNSTSMVSDMMVLSSVRTEFPMSPVQTVHMAAGSRYSGLTINIEENISEQHLRDILANIIAKQQMMHCIAKKKDEYLWSELDVEGQTPIIAQSISYTKLDMYDETTQKAITKKVIENLMYKDYREGELPWRLSCLRLSERNTLLIWCFDHTCFDGMSAEIIKRQILSKENLSKNSSKSSDIFTSSTIQCYEDYVAILKDGPKDIDEQEIVGKFRLDDWSRANAALMEKLEKVSDKNFKEVSISVPLNGRNQNVWACAYELVEKILQRYTGENDIAMAIVDYGRKYGGAEFYDCVGEFLDIIPVMLGQRKVEELEELLDICNNNSVNFLSLIFDKDLSEKYSEVSKNLKKYFATDKSCFDIVIYNFQGFISAEDRALMEESQSAEETESPMSKLFINANHDKDTLYLSLECPEGLNIDLIKTVVDNEGGTCTGK